MLKRTFTTNTVAKIVNHPSVQKFVIEEGQKGADDLRGIVQDVNNHCLFNSSGGIIFIKVEDGVYDVHQQWLPGTGHDYILEKSKEALNYIFANTDAFIIIGRIPKFNAPAKVLAKELGFIYKFDFSKWKFNNAVYPIEYYTLNVNTWHNISQTNTEYK